MVLKQFPLVALLLLSRTTIITNCFTILEQQPQTSFSRSSITTAPRSQSGTKHNDDRRCRSRPLFVPSSQVQRAGNTVTSLSMDVGAWEYTAVAFFSGAVYLTNRLENTDGSKLLEQGLAKVVSTTIEEEKTTTTPAAARKVWDKVDPEETPVVKEVVSEKTQVAKEAVVEETPVVNEVVAKKVVVEVGEEKKAPVTEEIFVEEVEEETKTPVEEEIAVEEIEKVSVATPPAVENIEQVVVPEPAPVEETKEIEPTPLVPSPETTSSVDDNDDDDSSAIFEKTERLTEMKNKVAYTIEKSRETERIIAENAAKKEKEIVTTASEEETTVTSLSSSEVVVDSPEKKGRSTRQIWNRMRQIVKKIIMPWRKFKDLK